MYWLVTIQTSPDACEPFNRHYLWRGEIVDLVLLMQRKKNNKSLVNAVRLMTSEWESALQKTTQPELFT